jgi:hypothetical protein
MPDSLTIQNGKIAVITEEGQRFERPEAQLVEMLRGELLPPLGAAALPDGVKFHEWRPPFLVVVHQQPPHVRQCRWIAPDSPKRFGPGVKYRKVRLSFPYALTFAVYFQKGNQLALAGGNELYFRNEPLRCRTDRVGFPALLNVSRIPTPQRDRAWICTQHLRCPPGSDWVGQLHALLEHTWNGGFNLSSEDHEGASWYGESKRAHADLHPVEQWEKATAANEAFGLGVPWLPAPLAVGELMEALLEEHRQALAAHGLPGAVPPKAGFGLIGRFLNHVQKK